MITQSLVEHLEETLSRPGSRDALAARIDSFASTTGTTLGPNDQQEMARLAENYVRSVVDLLVACDVAATEAGIVPFAGPVLQTAAGYFLQPADFIPDQQGLYGLLDDAYLACRFVTRISEMVQAERGFPLLDTSLDGHSPVIRVLIGEPLASRLDQEIEATLASVLAQVQMAQMQALQVEPRPGWNDWMHRENQINAEAEILAIGSGSW